MEPSSASSDRNLILLDSFAILLMVPQGGVQAIDNVS